MTVAALRRFASDRKGNVAIIFAFSLMPITLLTGMGIDYTAATTKKAMLDAARKQDILPYFERLRDEAKVPMIYVSHDAAELRQLATQIVMLRHGRVTAFGGVKVLSV